MSILEEARNTLILDKVLDVIEDETSHFDEVEKGLDKMGMSNPESRAFVKGVDYLAKAILEVIAKD